MKKQAWLCERKGRRNGQCPGYIRYDLGVWVWQEASKLAGQLFIQATAQRPKYTQCTSFANPASVAAFRDYRGGDGSFTCQTFSESAEMISHGLDCVPIELQILLDDMSLLRRPFSTRHRPAFMLAVHLHARSWISTTLHSRRSRAIAYNLVREIHTPITHVFLPALSSAVAAPWFWCAFFANKGFHPHGRCYMVEVTTTSMLWGE